MAEHADRHVTYPFVQDSGVRQMVATASQGAKHKSSSDLTGVAPFLLWLLMTFLLPCLQPL